MKSMSRNKKGTATPAVNMEKHAPSGRSYLCRMTVGKDGRQIY
jgi:hypothetical protein